jgi:hypothetical protein
LHSIFLLSKDFKNIGGLLGYWGHFTRNDSNDLSGFYMNERTAGISGIKRGIDDPLVDDSAGAGSPAVNSGDVPHTQHW